MSVISGIKNALKTLVVAGKYSLENMIDNGSFGEIYLGTDQSNGKKVAVKLEPVCASLPVLHIENKIYKCLGDSLGFAQAFWYGQESDYNVLVMDYLGPSVEKLLHKCSGRFSLKTVLMLSLQMIDRIEYLHKRKFIHRDIKPENFLMGNDKYSATVFLVDFGLSKKYRNSNDCKHIKMETNKAFVGSSLYSSVNVHRGLQQSRRDDLISLGYVIVYLSTGKLPWQNIKVKTLEEKLIATYNLKVSTSVEVLCKDLPQEFSDYLSYCLKLEFEEAPDYCYLRQLFRCAIKRNNNKLSRLQFDWEVKEIEKRDSVLTSKQQIERLLRPGSTYFNLNPYAVLQIEPETSLDEVKKKYKRLSILVHPDKNQDDPDRAQKAFEIINKAWKTLESEETRSKCLDVIEEAKARTDHTIAEKRKKQKKEGKDSQVEEDDPIAYNHALYVTTTKLFADMERRRRDLEVRDTEERKRKREQEIEEEEKAKIQKEWQKNFDESQQSRVNSWKAFQAGGSGGTSVKAKDTKTKKFKGFKPPKHKAESR